jgi:hypothetical protein
MYSHENRAFKIIKVLISKVSKTRQTSAQVLLILVPGWCTSLSDVSIVAPVIVFPYDPALLGNRLSTQRLLIKSSDTDRSFIESSKNIILTTISRLFLLCKLCDSSNIVVAMTYLRCSDMSCFLDCSILYCLAL